MNQLFLSKSLDDTYNFGAQIAQILSGGEVIELIGDVGAGKTTFVSGIVKALGSKDRVSSPTFKICNSYKGKNLIVHHCDFYRLGGNDVLIKNELSELIAPDAVVILEWSEVLGIDLGKTIKIKIDTIDENTREFEVINK
jgi:tRNA threonylcarbamoyladenosine biosynthesis protein TsaE